MFILNVEGGYISYLRLQNNIISNNVIGVQFDAYSQEMTIVENQICNNSIYNIVNNTDLNFELYDNCWCTSDSLVVEDSETKRNKDRDEFYEKNATDLDFYLNGDYELMNSEMPIKIFDNINNLIIESTPRSDLYF
jgi:hypothetical protein